MDANEIKVSLLSNGRSGVGYLVYLHDIGPAWSIHHSSWLSLYPDAPSTHTCMVIRYSICISHISIQVKSVVITLFSIFGSRANYGSTECSDTIKFEGKVAFIITFISSLLLLLVCCLFIILSLDYMLQNPNLPISVFLLLHMNWWRRPILFYCHWVVPCWCAFEMHIYVVRYRLIFTWCAWKFYLIL